VCKSDERRSLMIIYRCEAFASQSRLTVLMLVLGAMAVGCAALLPASTAVASIGWDGEGNDGIWFNPANWNRNSNSNLTLPPGDSASGVTDTEISLGTASLNGGLGVIYNPTNGAPFFPPSASVLPPPSGFSYQHINQLYLSRSASSPTSLVPDNTLTIQGDLQADGAVIIGRSSGVAGTATNGKLIQTAGTFSVPLTALDLGANEQGINSRLGYGNGTYDYRGGNLEVGATGGAGLRLSAGGTGGPGGIGRVIMHNPATPGHVRAFDMTIAGAVGANASFLPDGITTGVGIVEFHFENGGTRPIQVNRNLIIDNGTVATPAGANRSARLQLVLDAPPPVNGSGVPQDLGLFDVAFSDSTGTSTTGSGSLGDLFSSADGSTLYTQGATVSATYAGSTYNWTISYTGNITWSNADDSAVGSLSDTGGVDVVLKGLSSVIAPPGLAGDFNNDGKVDAADYSIWRKNSANASLPNDNGLTTQADRFNLWRANFGKPPGAGSGLGASAVPEPCTCGLALCFVVGGLLAHRRR
jgi:hypothetical protein